MATCPSCSETLGPDHRFCTACGKPVSSARTNASPAPAVPSATGFRWMWALLTIPIAVGTVLVSAVGVGLVVGILKSRTLATDPTDDAMSDAVATGAPLIVLGSMVFAGLVVGMLSPGRTVREPGAGLAAAVIAMNLIGGNSQGVVMGWVLPFALGAGGAWVGEWLQGRFTAR